MTPTGGNDHPAIINYLELAGGDMEATKRFYADAFGWPWTDYGPGYSAFETAGLTIGLNAAGAPAPPTPADAEDAIGPLVLFETDDLHKTLNKIRTAAGRISSGPYAYPGGRRFHFLDPAGNTLGVYQTSPLQ